MGREGCVIGFVVGEPEKTKRISEYSYPIQ